MRKFALLVGLVLLAGMPALAQDYPKGEFYAGYAYHRIAGVNVPAGFAVNFAGNFHTNVGIVGDFGYGTKSGANAYSYMGGVRLAGRGEKATGFVHAMVGGATIGNGASTSGLAFGFGGGVDAYATDRVGFRGEFLWIPTRFSGVWETESFRFGAGIVVKWGQ